jgi:hypothetical protein
MPKKSKNSESGLYEREDWTSFRTLANLAQKSGVPAGWLRRVVVKELADNALDKAGTCSVGMLANGGFFVENPGEGIPGEPEDVAALFSIRRQIASSKVFRLLTRGALGNGLRVVVGAVLSSGGTLEVWTQSRHLRLTPQFDTGETIVEAEPADRIDGTRIELTLGESVPEDSHCLASAKIAIEMAKPGPIYKGKTSTWFYDTDSFLELLHAAGERTIRDVIEGFDGCSGKNAGSVAKAYLGRKAASLSREESDDLLQSARAHAKPVNPKRIKFVGPQTNGLLAGYLHAKTRGEYSLAPGQGKTSAELPYSVEAWAKPIEGKDSITICVNRTPVTGDVRIIRHIKEKSEIVVHGCNLGYSVKVGRKPVALILNVQCPYIPIVTDGKEPDLEHFYAEVIDVLGRAARKAQKMRRVTDPSAKPPSLIKAVSAEMAKGIAQTSGGGRIIFPKRNLFYSIRDLIQNHTEQELKWKYFEGIVLKQWEKKHGPVPGMYCDPRGYFIEPHTGTVIPLGTREVEAYTIPPWRYDKILYVEKKGFHELLKSARLAERYDIGIICAEGYAADAAKLLLARAQQMSNMRVGCLHDADPYGYNIARRLKFLTRSQSTIEVIDIGLRLEEGLALAIKPEIFFRKKALPEKLLPLLNDVEREYFEGERIRDKLWKCRRIELNALAAVPERFIEYVENKLHEHQCDTKLVPQRKVINDFARGLREDLLHDAVREGLLSAIGEDVIHEIVRVMRSHVPITSLPLELKRWALNLTPQSWTQYMTSSLHGAVVSVDQRLRDQVRAKLAELGASLSEAVG